MTLKQIEGFCYLAQTLNFSRAAEMIYLSQPAFSRMIVNMEEELGCELFVRSKTNPRLTSAGEQIYKKMKTIRKEYEDICGIAHIAKLGKLGNLRVGMLDNGLTPKSRNHISRFSAENPNVILELKEYTEAQMFRALEMNWIDVAYIVHFPQNLKKELDGIVTEESRECVVFHRSHPLSEKKEISISELKEEPMIMLREEKSELGYNKVMESFLSHGFLPNVSSQADSVAGALTAVSCNLGCAILTDSLKRLAGEEITFVPVKNAPKCKHWIVWKKENFNDTIAKFILTSEQ